MSNILSLYSNYVNYRKKKNSELMKRVNELTNYIIIISK